MRQLSEGKKIIEEVEKFLSLWPEDVD